MQTSAFLISVGKISRVSEECPLVDSVDGGSSAPLRSPKALQSLGVKGGAGFLPSTVAGTCRYHNHSMRGL